MEPIMNDIPNTIITGTAQADSINNNAGNVSINSGAGNDSIENNGDNVSIVGGADDDLITNLYGISATIDGGAGDDSIDNSGEKALINLGDGNNSVSNGTNSDDVTIKSGAGNDSISNVSANLLIQYGGGSDIIEGFNSTSTLQILSGSIDNAISDGVDAVFTIGDGSITFKDLDTVRSVNIINADGELENFTIPVVIMGTEQPESISNDIDNATIQALGGNDTITNSGISVAIYGGNDNDEIDNNGDNVSIYGDAGDDYILNPYGINVIIDGGDGNDTIENSGASTAIYGGNDNDSIKTSGDNVSIFGDKGNDVIDNTGVSIDGGKGNDFIDNSGDNISIVGGKGNDTVTLNTSNGGNIFVYSSGDGNDKIYSLSENDTIKIVGNSNVKASVKSGENEYDIIFKIGMGSITLKDESYEKKVTLVDADNNPLLVDNIYTLEGIIRGNTIELSSTLKETYQQGAEITFVGGSKLKTGIEIEGGYTDGGTLIGGLGNDTIYGEDKFELTGGKGNDLFAYGGGSVVITDYSTKGTYGRDKISLSGGFYEVVRHEIDDDNNLILIFDDDTEVTNKLTIENGGNKEIIFAGDDETSVNIHTDEGVLNARRKSITLPAATDNFSAATSKYSKLVTIDGAAAEKAINIVGNNKGNYIFAGVEGATLNGGKGNDKLYGNEYSGVDLFVYEKNSGRDTIYNYNYYYDESDRISLGNDVTIKDAYIKKDKDSVIKFKSGSITVEDATDVIFVQNGVETLLTEGVFLDEAASTAKTFGSFKGEINLNAYEDIKNVDASITKKAISIEGDFEDNYLTGGKGKDEITGNDGKDTLLGGKGNDTLWGGRDEDTFIYQVGSGIDYIMDYEDGELLQILDKKGKASTFKKAVFSEDTLTLTIKGGGKVVFKDILDAEITFNINGDSYGVSGETIVKK